MKNVILNRFFTQNSLQKFNENETNLLSACVKKYVKEENLVTNQDSVEKIITLSLKRIEMNTILRILY